MNELAVCNPQIEEEKKTYISFNINKEYYGIDVSYVNNIIQTPAIKRVPKTPEHFVGIINVRGDIIPVVSLRRKMNLEEDSYTKNSRVLILNLDNDKNVGILVDSVKEVLTIPGEDIVKDPSPFLRGSKTMISGIGKKDDDLISIFNVEALV